MTRTRVAAAGAVLVILLIGLYARTSRHGTPPAPVAAAPTVTMPAVTPGQTATSAPPVPTSAAAVGTGGPGDPRPVAYKFVTAWASRTSEDTTATWLARMRPYAAEPLLAQLSQAAPDAVQAHHAIGPITILNSGQFGAQAVVPVDAGPTPLVGLSSTGDRWLVTSLTAVQPAQT